MLAPPKQAMHLQVLILFKQLFLNTRVCQLSNVQTHWGSALLLCLQMMQVKLPRVHCGCHTQMLFLSVLAQQAMWHAGKTQNELPPAELQQVDVSDLEHSTGSSTNGSSVNDDTAAAHSEAHSGAADNDSGKLSPVAMPVTLPANVREEFYGDLCKLCQSLALALPFTQDELQGLGLEARCVHC